MDCQTTGPYHFFYFGKGGWGGFQRGFPHLCVVASLFVPRPIFLFFSLHFISFSLLFFHCCLPLQFLLLFPSFPPLSPPPLNSLVHLSFSSSVPFSSTCSVSLFFSPLPPPPFSSPLSSSSLFLLSYRCPFLLLLLPPFSFLLHIHPSLSSPCSILQPSLSSSSLLLPPFCTPLSPFIFLVPASPPPPSPPCLPLSPSRAPFPFLHCPFLSSFLSSYCHLSFPHCPPPPFFPPLPLIFLPSLRVLLISSLLHSSHPFAVLLIFFLFSPPRNRLSSLFSITFPHLLISFLISLFRYRLASPRRY